MSDLTLPLQCCVTPSKPPGLSVHSREGGNAQYATGGSQAWVNIYTEGLPERT